MENQEANLPKIQLALDTLEIDTLTNCLIKEIACCLKEQRDHVLERQLLETMSIAAIRLRSVPVEETSEDGQ